MTTKLDPTYNMDEIEANPVWKRAFELSEENNDDAPLGWGRWIEVAQEEMAKED